MRLPIPLVAASLAAWLIGGIYLQRQNCCGNASSNMVAPIGMRDTVYIRDTVKINQAAYATVATPIPTAGTPTTSVSASSCAFAPSIGRINNMTEDLRAELNKVTNYLKVNPNRAVRIIGNYCKTENNSSLFNNIGIARANSVKNELVRVGVPACQISLESSLDCVTANTCFDNGVSFKYENATNTQLKLATSEANIRNKPMMVCFDKGSSKLQLEGEQRVFFKDLAQCASCYPNAVVRITGYGNSIEEGCCGSCLGKDRADMVKAYLKKLGLKGDVILTKGDDIANSGLDIKTGCVTVNIE
jgi:outer membrane protein OmpA-like peptidoglycan-associated protein